uniref:Uncharacterized protein n=1 Tax=Mesocestoides corti TaxID=53468 RepID=A0A5K3FZL8_MESCO
MAILKVLRELYDMRDVEHRIKGQIEMLFRVFNFTVEDVTAAVILCDQSHLANLETQLIFCGGGGGESNLPLPATVNLATAQEQQRVSTLCHLTRLCLVRLFSDVHAQARLERNTRNPASQCPLTAPETSALFAGCSCARHFNGT